MDKYKEYKDNIYKGYCIYCLTPPPMFDFRMATADFYNSCHIPEILARIMFKLRDTTDKSHREFEIYCNRSMKTFFEKYINHHECNDIKKEFLTNIRIDEDIEDTYAIFLYDPKDSKCYTVIKFIE